MSRTQINIFDEIIVDNFAGGGGASTGIELAAGRPVTIAINHDPAAILLHKTNHPYTEHMQTSVWDVDPVEVCKGRPVGLAWFSPDCKHFSKAKGSALVDRNIRGLAWIVLRWAGTVRPRVIMLENVEEFKTWGPVRKGKPVKKKAGQTFRKWLQQLEDLGYWPQIRQLLNKYCDYRLQEDEVILLIIGGVAYYISGIELRMLVPREQYAAMAFPPDYAIERDYLGNAYPKNQQTAKCGNAVSPVISCAMVKANLPEWCGTTIVTMAQLHRTVAV